jgi:4-amino-4-deoxy-L-arabinose transferase-like glycosyltransferase
MAFALANTLLLFVLAGRFVSPPLAFLATAWTVLSPVYDTLAVVVLAEQPVIFFTLLTLIALERWTRSGWRWDRWALLAAAALSAGMMVKGVLAAAVPALLAFALLVPGSRGERLHRCLRAALLLAAALLPWLAWGVRCAFTPAVGYDGLLHLREMETGRMSAEHARSLVERLVLVRHLLTSSVPYRAADLFAGVGWMLDTQWTVALGMLPRAALLLFLAVLLVKGLLAFRSAGLLTLMATASISLLLTFHAGGAARYWSSVTPLLVLLLMLSVEGWIVRRWGREGMTASALTGIVVLAAAASSAPLVLEHLHRRPQFGGPWADFVQAGEEIGRRTEPSAVVLGHNILALQLISRRYTAFAESDWQGLTAAGPMRRQVFVLAPDPQCAIAREVTAGWAGNWLGVRNSELAWEDLPGRRVEVWRNASYRLVQLEPSGLAPGSGDGR